MTIGRQGLFQYSSKASSDNGNYERKVYEERNRKNEFIEEKRSRLLYQSRKRGKYSLVTMLLAKFNKLTDMQYLLASFDKRYIGE